MFIKVVLCGNFSAHYGVWESTLPNITVMLYCPLSEHMAL